MTLCPIAAAMSCTRCPAYKICPATRLLGDQKRTPAADSTEKPASQPKAGQQAD
ncbi:hypothetical protein [Marinobacter mobilis]|uniref:hypothetical protein n=1 Tax=Marinobacter mobilis TaxID=488533 RepID=UPI0035C6CEBD